MLLTEPPPSQGDLHFRVFGFPVRIHPFFWVTTVLTGINTKGGTPPSELLIWIGVVFVSILVHELGHAFLQRRFGGRPWITLHGIGGLASCDDCDRSPHSQILISLAGPAAGFLFALTIIILSRVTGHPIGVTWSPEIALRESGITTPDGLGFLGLVLYWEALAPEAANSLLRNILFVNIVWGLVNLLPVYPLDGGRVSRELCTLRHPRRGIILSLRISVITAIAMAAVGLFAWQSFLTAFMFGYLAYTNYQTLQAYQENRW